MQLLHSTKTDIILKSSLQSRGKNPETSIFHVEHGLINFVVSLTFPLFALKTETLSNDSWPFASILLDLATKKIGSSIILKPFPKMSVKERNF